MNQNITVYVIEDDPDISDIIKDNLAIEGYQVRCFNEGKEAYQSIMDNHPDLIILDLNLPGMSGIEICKYVRDDNMTQEIPIIMVTARSEEIDKIIGFEVGADDYITKPFSPRELLARVKVQLRKRKTKAFEIYEQSGLNMNFSTHELFIEKKAVDLTPIQFKLLKSLIQANGKVLSREALIELVWDDNYYGDPRTVDVHITRLREKIKHYGKSVLTVKGVGYRWKLE